MRIWTFTMSNGGVAIVSIDQASISKGATTDAQWEAHCLNKLRPDLPPGAVLAPMDSADLPADLSNRKNWVRQGSRVVESPVDLDQL